MAVRTALLTSRNINLDTDFSKYIETVSEPGVITGFAVTSSSVATGQARVPCIRTNLETIYAFVQNFNSVSISGDGYVIISIPQNIIDNWGGNEDGTGIATIEVVNELPAKNYLLLATITSGDVEDNRNMIPKVGELKTDIDSIFASIEDLDERVDALEEAAAIDHLEKRAIVWEKYLADDILFNQFTPKLADCTIDANVWDVAANTEIHIQRQGSKTPSNKLKLKVKKVGSPTTSVVVEVRKGIKVDVSSREAYWYGDSENIIATGTLASSSFTNDYAEVEFILDANFGGTEWELLDVVVYQTTGSGAIVNASNYYCLACDSTQRSEWFGLVKVNWETKERSKYMPYCISNAFVSNILSKYTKNWIYDLATSTGNKTNQSTNYNQYGTIFSIEAVAWKKTRGRISHLQWLNWSGNVNPYNIKQIKFKDEDGNYWEDNIYSDFSKSYEFVTEDDGKALYIERQAERSDNNRTNNCYFQYDMEYWHVFERIPTKKIIPIEVKNVWEFAKGIVFWFLQDNTRWDGN